MVSNSPTGAVRVWDIHPSNESFPRSSIRHQILSGLAQPTGHKTLPTLLLYDECGLLIYDEITTDATEYYLFPAEKEILKNKVDEIVGVMMHRCVRDSGLIDEAVVELGAGALRKTSLILSAFARLVPNSSPIPSINYYALDLEKSELERTLMELNASEIGAQLKGRVATFGLCGTYEDGLKFIEEGGLEARTQLERIGTSSLPRYSMEHVGRVGSFSSATSSHCDTEEMDAATPRPSSEPQSPLHILFIGSSLGNFPRGEDATFLRSLPLRPGSGDTLLLGMDHGDEAQQIEAAYNDSRGITRKFVMNGLASVGRILGDKYLFDEDKWQYIGKYNKELRKCRHEAYYKSTCDQTVIDPETKMHIPFVKDELIHVAVSNKFSESDAYTLFADANLRPIHRWTDSSQRYSFWLLERPKFPFPLRKTPSSESLDCTV